MSNNSHLHISPLDRLKADEIAAKYKNTLGHTLNDAEKNILCRILSGSPYLTKLIENDNDFFVQIMSKDPEELIKAILTTVKNCGLKEGLSKKALMNFLREQKSKLALLIAYHDLSHNFSLRRVTEILSNFADLAVKESLNFLFSEAINQEKIANPDGLTTANIIANSGYFILALGKLGASELNYSSDIDLIALFDSSRNKIKTKENSHNFYIKITKELIDIISKKNSKGYIFRTDFRLRPDPGSTPLVMTVFTAQNYYQSQALNWERAAMIKARALAGDIKTAEVYLDDLSPWIWRRSIDYTALNEIAAIKDQLRTKNISVSNDFEDYDVKVGSGGIREIEFYTQIQQLLHGGRDHELRNSGTLKSLYTLAEKNIISTEAATNLERCYVFLRTLEHRLQMINDKQTHRVPKDPELIKKLVCLSGYPDKTHLKTALTKVRTIVQSYYRNLLPADKQAPTNLTVPELLQGQLKALEFENPDTLAELILDWQTGRYRALRTEQARSLLAQCLPVLLEYVAENGAPDFAIIKLDKFLSELPAGVQLFSLLHANKKLLKLLARILSVAPSLAETLSRHPAIWDYVLDPEFFMPVPARDTLYKQLGNQLKRAQNYEDILNITQRFVSEMRFRIGVLTLQSVADMDESMAAMTAVADTALKCLLRSVQTEFEKSHGTFNNGELSVIAMGQYGSCTLTFMSDLDLVLLYKTDKTDKVSNGARQLAPSTYYSRLGQKFITAVTALTKDGRLFDVDTRLRPFGTQGPLVVTLETFKNYYSESAWTWEHMALTRARVVLSSCAFKKEIEKGITDILGRERSKDELLIAVAEMRKRLAHHHPRASKLDMKNSRGGLIDIDFIYQYFFLKHASKLINISHPAHMNPFERLVSLKALTKKEAETLSHASNLQYRVLSLLRLCLGAEPPLMDDITTGIIKVISKATGLNGMSEITSKTEFLQQEVYRIYKKKIDNPAQKLEQTDPN